MICRTGDLDLFIAQELSVSTAVLLLFCLEINKTDYCESVGRSKIRGKKFSSACVYPEMSILSSLVTSFCNGCLGNDTTSVMFALMMQKEGNNVSLCTCARRLVHCAGRVVHCAGRVVHCAGRVAHCAGSGEVMHVHVICHLLQIYL
jgi:hypothetical protein